MRMKSQACPVAVTTILVVLGAGWILCSDERPLWLAVGHRSLLEALDPLVEHRRRQGFETLLATPPLDEAVSSAPRHPDYILLVGDDEPGSETEPWYLPARRRVLERWRFVQKKDYASDAVWGDLDADLWPDTAVGRIPARTAREVEVVVRKVLAFERRAPREGDLDLNIWAGSPGYGALIDATSTGMLLNSLQTLAPSWARRWVVSADPLHPLCGWPPDQAGLFSRRLRQGGVCSALMGHGSAEAFFSMRHGGKSIKFDVDDARRTLSTGPPIAPVIIFACSCGSYTGTMPSLAESLLFLPGGPVATVAASTESHPLMNFFSGQALLMELGERERRFGKIWLHAQRRARRMRNFLVERALAGVEGEGGSIDMEKLRRDQMLMYVVLGDPATLLWLPRALEARTERIAGGWRWTADRPTGATRLIPGFRPAHRGLSGRRTRQVDEETARREFLEANRSFAFEPLPALPAGQPWTGVVSQAGVLRLVATGPETIFVAVLVLENGDG